MNIDIYHSKLNNLKYVAIPHKEDVASYSFGDPDLSSVELMNSKLAIELAKPVVGLNIEETISDIENNGFSVFQAKMQFTENLSE